MKNSNQEKEDFDFFKEKQLNSTECPSFLALGLYTVGKAINKKNLMLAFWLTCGGIAFQGGIGIVSNWQKNKNIVQEQTIAAAQEKINEKISFIKTISKEDASGILSYMDRVATVSTQYQQENLHYIEFYRSHEIFNDNVAGYLNNKTIAAGNEFISHLQKRKEVISQTIDQVNKGLTKSLPQTNDGNDPLDLVITWNSMYKQNTAYVSENIIEIRKNFMENYRNPKALEAQEYVTEKMKQDKTSVRIKIN